MTDQMDGPAERAADELEQQKRAAVEEWARSMAAPAPAPEWTDPNLKPGPGGGVAVIQGLVEAMRLLPAVGKDQQHKGDRTGTWNYRSADAVVSAVGPALAQAGVVLLPVLNSDEPITLGGYDGWRLDMTYRFFGVDGSSLSFRMVSHSVGQTAYTIGAGYSYALKYALSQALCLPFDDDRMDMESSSSHGAIVSWWREGGWESGEQHDERRAVLFETLKAMAQEQRGPVVAELAGLKAHPVYNPGGYKVAGGAVWTPTEMGNPQGPGRLVARLSVAAMEAAEKIAGISPRGDDGLADDGLPAEPEFDVDGPGDEQGTLDEAAEAAGEPPYTEPGTPTGEGDGADGLEPAKRQRRPRGSRKAQEATEAAGATETGPAPEEGQEGPAGAADGAPSARALTAEQVKVAQGALSRSLIHLTGEWGARAAAALTDAGCWPIGDLKDSIRLDRAADVLFPLLVEAGVVPKNQGAEA